RGAGNRLCLGGAQTRDRRAIPPRCAAPCGRVLCPGGPGPVSRLGRAPLWQQGHRLAAEENATLRQRKAANAFLWPDEREGRYLDFDRHVVLTIPSPCHRALEKGIGKTDRS